MHIGNGYSIYFQNQVHCTHIGNGYSSIYFQNQVHCTCIGNEYSLIYFQNQAQVATSLQVFHNLGSLKHIVDSEIATCKNNLHTLIKSCLDVQALSSQQTGPQGKGI